MPLRRPRENAQNATTKSAIASTDIIDTTQKETEKAIGTEINTDTGIAVDMKMKTKAIDISARDTHATTTMMATDRDTDMATIDIANQQTPKRTSLSPTRRCHRAKILSIDQSLYSEIPG